MSGRRGVLLSRMCVGAGVTALGIGCLGVGGAFADAAPGSGLGALELHARAVSVRVTVLNTGAGGEDAAGNVPFASSELASGGRAHSIASIAWPGETGANLGTLLLLVLGSCSVPDPTGVLPPPPTCPPSPPPSTYSALNDPVRAEAETGSAKTSDHLTQPGLAMSALATPAQSLSDAWLTGSSTPAIGDTFGATRADTTAVLTGPKTAVLTATSSVRDVRIAGGLITIGSVTSVARATTDGVHASGTGHTTVQDARIDGVPVTIDQNGVHAAGQGASFAQAEATVNGALAHSGFQIFVARPLHTTSGGAVTVDSGDLIVAQTDPRYTGQANNDGQVVQLGGASLVGLAAPGFPFLGLLPPPPPGGTTTTASSSAAAPATSAATGAAPAAPGTAPVVAGAPARAPLVAAQRPALPGGLAAGWIVLVALGSLFAAAGLRRVPDRLLTAAGSACPLGES